jgi:hypothetical protein
MKQFRIPFRYLSEAVANIQANSLQEAIEIANIFIKTNTTLLQQNVSESIDESYLVLRDKAVELN